MQLDFVTRFASIPLLITVLSACGSGSNSHNFTLGGSISGLTSSGLILTDDNQQVSPSSGATAFTFPNTLKSGTTYAVQVSASPSGLTCGVTHATGTIGGNVTSVAVTCFPAEDTVLHSFAGGTSDGASPPSSLIEGSDGNFYGMTATGGSSNLGTVFKITPDGTATVLHSFAGGASDGASPQGSLIEGSDGNFYGMTITGGGSNLGTVFKIAPDGTATVLHSFVGGTSDGASPHDSLIQGSDSNFYGMTTAGGSSNLGTVFKIAVDGTETVLHSFVAGTDGASPQGNLVQGNDGNFYGMTHAGGTTSQGTVFKIAPDGTESVLYSFNSTLKDGTVPRGSLIQGNDGNFYGMTTIGGNLNLGVVFKITPEGTESVLYVFGSSASDGITPYGSLILGNDGNLYGMTNGGGSLNLGTVFKITPDGTKTTLYSFAGGASDGASPQGGLIQGSDGSFYGMTTAGGNLNLGAAFKVVPQ